EQSDPDLYSEGKPIRQIKKKVLILGEGGVGKTTLLYRYVNQVFIDSTKMTIGSDFFVKKIKYIDDKYENRLTMLLWDFAGQERFRFILKDYTKGAECVFLVFDLVRFNSLNRLNNWLEILKEGGVWGNPKVTFILVGTKKDMIGPDMASVPESSITDFQKEFGIDQYFETSSKDGTGIEDLFEQVAHTLINQEDEK
ncbi:MAG: GTP-binding protein, partial [Promethearchaeota archaeon]